MKILALFLLALSSAGAFAKNTDNLDGTPSLAAAKNIALNYATDSQLGDVLSAESKMVVRFVSQDTAAYNFVVSAEGCSLKVRVSKELGVASSEEGMACAR